MIWLSNLSREDFLAKHFHKAPYAEPGSARGARPLMTWDKVAALLAARPRPDLIVSRGGEWLAGHDPETVDDAQNLFASGCSIVLRNVDRFDEDLAQLALAFGGELPGDVTVHVFATPMSHVGFGWHYDAEDVFIVQTAGTKEYLLRQNTVNPEPTIRNMPRDMQFERETSQVIACTLAAGDWLYIPRGWWHRAKGVDDALSMSIGVLSPAAGGTPRG